MVTLNLCLPYCAADADLASLLTPAEVAEAQRLTLGAQRAFLVERRAALTGRITVHLFRIAMDAVYADPRTGQVRMPRRDGDGRSPGRWWGELEEAFAEDPTSVSLDDGRAEWLLSVWADDRAQNAFARQLQRWVNVLDVEMERLRGDGGDAARAE